MAEGEYRQVDCRVEINPHDSEGRVIVLLDPRTQEEIGREEFSRYLLLMTGILDLVTNSPDQLCVSIQRNEKGKITRTKFERRASV